MAGNYKKKLAHHKKNGGKIRKKAGNKKKGFNFRTKFVLHKAVSVCVCVIVCLVCWVS